MFKEKRGQAAMEFLMTYGWAILAACLVLLVGILYFGESSKIQLDKFNLVNKGDDFGVGSDEDVGNSGGGSGSGDDSSSVNEIVGGVDFVPDIDAVECGFYFKEYGVCAGTCPDGECVSEGRSCYCKNT